MLDKLSLNKIIIIFSIIFVAASCSMGEKRYYNIEVTCPGRDKILIKFARAADVRAAIIRSDFEKRKERTSGNYTPIRLPGNRSLIINKISPEEMINCSLYESNPGEVERDYIRYF